MEEDKIIPFEGLGSLRFSETRAAIRALLNDPDLSFRKGSSTSTLTDAYNALGLHLFYDAQDCLEFIETFPPCNPVFEGQTFSGLPIEMVVTAMRARGHQPNNDGLGDYIFEDLGIALYVPDEDVESVAVYRHGYYDSVGGNE